ncbi:TPA: HTH domain-containing protein [Streptococcus suis]
MLSKKEIRLLEFLIDHPDDYVSSLEIAQQLHISDRTARTYLKQLTASLQNSGSQLLSKPVSVIICKWMILVHLKPFGNPPFLPKGS